ncbi:ABC-type polysaccharide/polyol phosphate transport system ATPase subunit [Brevibacterium sanguinis]|uniref:ABC-type polysaccharide/polyol phosphate transport system ATPase subunit n=2 Tax=Brevibacterium TaxID=1696 RepID=A0A366IEA3_9MICO|nr:MULTISPECIES: ABC transporter ATP-binding protein [Brevibacterium]RBP62937.1 ABC-type polysaccharide/polyol phosphate transport system ATPase subunit [Brevibacterium sanguinis]RBP69518.1 ABC-type polysaccharide/polyol phosphate transport system ATPase subunit [Brevibacterium celere]
MDALEHSPANIIAEDVQVRYTVGTKDPTHRSKGLHRLADVALGRQGQTTVRALRGVNLVAREGEMVGIVGANGSGKSTFLRNVAGVEQPDRGRILVRYQPLLLGVQAALQPSLSGSENVRLGCLAMGLTPEEAAEAYEYVVDLSALGKAIHRPMGTYSSGMGARLRFAIALAARPKILLIDEALSTGDASFAERSERAMDELLAEAGTVLLVNHAAKVIQELCTRAVWMHHGEIIMDGPAEPVAEKYRWWAWNVAKGKEDVADKLLHDVVRSAQKEEINILEPELVKNPIPRHAKRPTKGRKPIAARHVKRREVIEEVEEAAELPLSASTPTVWPEKIEGNFAQATFPVLPKPAVEAVSIQRAYDEPPPLRYRPREKRVMLRAADPRDRASAVAESNDLTSKRLASTAHRAAEERYRLRQQMRGEFADSPNETLPTTAAGTPNSTQRHRDA